MRGYSEAVQDCAELFATEKDEVIKMYREVLNERVNVFNKYTSVCSTALKMTKTHKSLTNPECR